MKLIYGVGINDANYLTLKLKTIEELRVGGKNKQKQVWKCPYYSKWKGMLRRCYSKKVHVKQPTYKDCTVCDIWLTFSNFKDWMIKQDWTGMELDKDLLLEGNRVYSPETCVFVSKIVNGFIKDTGCARGEYLIGCNWYEHRKKFKSQCNDPFNKKQVYLGYFYSEIEAHLAWKKQKHIYSCQLANSDYVTDERVRQTLIHKYENYTIVEGHIN